jgi:hypothetical protein
MTSLPEYEQQIIRTHAPFIRQVVEWALQPDRRDDLEKLLKTASDNGWTALVTAIRLIINGRRDPGVLQSLDREDTAIAEAVMRGLQNPATLPTPEEQADPTAAAPGLASMIQAAATGNVEALKIVADMAEQMQRAGGPMARIAATIRPMINGERDPDKLCKGMNARAERLVLQILDELGKSRRH